MGSKPRKVVKKAPVKDSGPLYNPILSTNGGRHAYVCCGDRTSPLLATDSDAFAELVISEGYLRHVEELAEISNASEVWAETYERIKA
jgi:hypothetical protein